MPKTVKHKLDGFSEYLRKEGCSETTVRLYTSYVRHVLKHLDDDMSQVADVEIVRPLLVQLAYICAWRKYRAYILHKQEESQRLQIAGPPWIPCELERVNKAPSKKGYVDPMYAHAVKSVLAALEGMAVDRSHIVMLHCGDVAISEDGLTGCVHTIAGDKVIVPNVQALKILMAGKDLNSGLVVSPWTSEAATWADWKRLATLADETPIDKETYLDIHCLRPKVIVQDFHKETPRREMKPAPKIAKPLKDIVKQDVDNNFQDAT